MKFLNEQGQEITLKRAENLPGYEVTLAEDTIIDSAVNNPFFKGINVLQLPKKLKGFRENPDLRKILQPIKVNTGVSLKLLENELVFFEANRNLVENNRLVLVDHLFGNEEKIQPMFINVGLKRLSLKAGTVIGNVIILHTKDGGS